MAIFNKHNKSQLNPNMEEEMGPEEGHKNEKIPGKTMRVDKWE